jgi:hypothetical protein
LNTNADCDANRHFFERRRPYFVVS